MSNPIAPKKPQVQFQDPEVYLRDFIARKCKVKPEYKTNLFVMRQALEKDMLRLHQAGRPRPPTALGSAKWPPAAFRALGYDIVSGKEDKSLPEGAGRRYIHGLALKA